MLYRDLNCIIEILPLFNSEARRMRKTKMELIDQSSANQTTSPQPKKKYQLLDVQSETIEIISLETK